MAVDRPAHEDSGEDCGTENAIELDAAIEALSEVLFWKMEHLEPSEEGEWSTLSERKKEFYRICIKAVLLERNAVVQALRLV